MNSQTKSLDIDGYSLRILSYVRGTDEQGHNAVEILSKDGRKFYGEWQAKWQDDKIHFSVEIIRFGYRTADNIPNPSADAIENFTSEEAKIIETLLPKLFNCRDVTDENVPFSVKRAIFNNHVVFRPNWISTNI